MRAVRQESVEAMRPVSIYTAGDRIEAEMLLEALQRNDIQGFREARGSGGVMDVYTGTSIYGEKIFVDERDAQEAKEIIDSILAQTELEVEPEDEITDQTVKSPRWLRSSMGVLLALLLAFLIGGTVLSIFF